MSFGRGDGNLRHQTAIARRAGKRLRALAGLTFILAALPGCSGGGGTSGPGIHVDLKDKAGARIGAGLIGAGGGGTDTFVGDLAQSGGGTWKGVLTASIDQDRTTFVLGTDCHVHIVGTQQVGAVLTKGSFGGEINATLVLTPKVAPSYSTTDTCMPVPATKASNGIEWLYFFVPEYAGTPVGLHLPDAPGGTWERKIGDAEHSEYTQDVDACNFFQQIVECYRHTTFTVTYRT